MCVIITSLTTLKIKSQGYKKGGAFFGLRHQLRKGLPSWFDILFSSSLFYAWYCRQRANDKKQETRTCGRTDGWQRTVAVLFCSRISCPITANVRTFMFAKKTPTLLEHLYGPLFSYRDVYCF